MYLVSCVRKGRTEPHLRSIPGRRLQKHVGRRGGREGGREGIKERECKMVGRGQKGNG